MSKQVIQKEPAHLINIRQKLDESLKQYIGHFNDKVILVRDIKETIMITTIMNRVKLGNFNVELDVKVSKTFNELLRKADSHIGREKSNRAKWDLYDLKVKGKRTLKPEFVKTKHQGNNSNKSGKTFRKNEQQILPLGFIRTIFEGY
ncbi:hypothetical protein ACH5RR_012489 [Cinchona calisaya]|uniref:Uncharacterized protein n=1 Tax=Cinchona calisaya TaxID=153742 RepID=A0ABD3A8F1_9GENT